MKKFLRLAALLLALATLIGWLATGAHRGWTKTSATEMQKDPVTELEFPVVRKTFVMGVELLGGGLLAAAALLGVSLFLKPQKPQTS